MDASRIFYFLIVYYKLALNFKLVEIGRLSSERFGGYAYATQNYS